MLISLADPSSPRTGIAERMATGTGSKVESDIAPTLYPEGVPEPA